MIKQAIPFTEFTHRVIALIKAKYDIEFDDEFYLADFASNYYEKGYAPSTVATFFVEKEIYGKERDTSLD